MLLTKSDGLTGCILTKSALVETHLDQMLWPKSIADVFYSSHRFLNKFLDKKQLYLKYNIYLLMMLAVYRVDFKSTWSDSFIKMGILLVAPQYFYFYLAQKSVNILLS
jgi:hypothetical protein